MNKLNVAEALKKGQWMVNFPIYIILFFGIGLSMYFVSLKLDNYLVGITIACSFILMWLWWSFQITKWKILAFGQVRNVHELRRKAIAQQLIWPEGSWFNKTAISSAAQKQQWQLIKKKFEIEDTLVKVVDNGSLPKETIVTNSTTLKWLYIILLIGAIVFAGYEYSLGDLQNAIIAIIGALIIGFSLLPKVINSKTQITLSNDGIQFKTAKMIPWAKIKKAEVITKGSRKNTSWYLDLTYENDLLIQDQIDLLDISNFSPSPAKLEKIINIYRQRNKKRTNK